MSLSPTSTQLSNTPRGGVSTTSLGRLLLQDTLESGGKRRNCKWMAREGGLKCEKAALNSLEMWKDTVLEWKQRDKRTIALISDVRTYPEVHLGGRELFPHISIGEIICWSEGGTFTANKGERWQDISAGSSGETCSEDTGYLETSRKIFIFA